MRWMAMTLLLLSAAPALAQLGYDPENPDIYLPDPPAIPPHVFPRGLATAETAIVSPAEAAPVRIAARSCSALSPCALATPAAR